MGWNHQLVIIFLRGVWQPRETSTAVTPPTQWVLWIDGNLQISVESWWGIFRFDPAVEFSTGREVKKRYVYIMVVWIGWWTKSLHKKKCLEIHQTSINLKKLVVWSRNPGCSKQMLFFLFVVENPYGISASWAPWSWWNYSKKWWSAIWNLPVGDGCYRINLTKIVGFPEVWEDMVWYYWIISRWICFLSWYII